MWSFPAEPVLLYLPWVLALIAQPNACGCTIIRVGDRGPHQESTGHWGCSGYAWAFQHNHGIAYPPCPSAHHSHCADFRFLWRKWLKCIGLLNIFHSNSLTRLCFHRLALPMSPSAALWVWWCLGKVQMFPGWRLGERRPHLLLFFWSSKDYFLATSFWSYPRDWICPTWVLELGSLVQLLPDCKCHCVWMNTCNHWAMTIVALFFHPFWPLQLQAARSYS